MMQRSFVVALLVLAGFASIASRASAQEVSPLRERAEQVAALLRGEGDPAALFAPTFLAQVPPEQMRAIAAQLREQHGAVRGLGSVEPRSATAATLAVEMERATLRIDLGMEAEPPHRLHTLLVTGVQVRGDSLGAVADELRGLPGQVSFAAARLGDGDPALLSSLEPDRPLAIGSAFKLFILAELSRQVRAGERRWNDVIPLDGPAQPGTLQNWPAGTPMTLYSLAALMISQSDNRATDTLLRAAGRENVEAMMARIGVQAAARNRPLLGTYELFTIKTAGDADYQAWLAADEAGRRRLLATRYTEARPDPSRFSGAPLRIAEIEWFASAADLVRTMDWLRRNGDDTARDLLAINPGGPGLRETFAYAGYKGGSEPGVLNLTWLTRSRNGTWYALAATWNNAEAPVEQARLTALMQRALQLLP